MNVLRLLVVGMVLVAPVSGQTPGAVVALRTDSDGNIAAIVGLVGGESFDRNELFVDVRAGRDEYTYALVRTVEPDGSQELRHNCLIRCNTLPVRAVTSVNLRTSRDLGLTVRRWHCPVEAEFPIQGYERAFVCEPE